MDDLEEAQAARHAAAGRRNVIAALVPPSCKVYTPIPLAKAVTAALGDEDGLQWLEPCAGRGAFLLALEEQGVSPHRVQAVDLDPVVETQGSRGEILSGRDFLDWTGSTEARFDRVVCNPPYVSIARLSEPLRRTALAQKYPNQTHLGASANYWCAFIAASIRVMRPKSSFAFILPAAWDYADYAKPLRCGLPKMFREFEVHRCAEPLFSTVQEGSVILIARGLGEQPQSTVRHEYATRDGLIQGLAAQGKGTRLAAAAPVIRERSDDSGHVSLSEIMRITIGGVTGDSDFFLMTEEQRKERDLPRRSVRPVVSKARHLADAEITKEKWNALLRAGHRLWLFDPDQAQCSKPAVCEYLALEESAGGCHRNRHKVRGRSPWFHTPMPARCDGFMSGMGKHGPWIALSAMHGLAATNTLYVVNFVRAQTRDERFAWALSLLRTETRKQIADRCRVYADGLAKYEPGDLKDLRLTTPPFTAGAADVYRTAVQLLAAGHERRASALADAWFC